MGFSTINLKESQWFSILFGNCVMSIEKRGATILNLKMVANKIL